MRTSSLVELLTGPDRTCMLFLCKFEPLELHVIDANWDIERFLIIFNNVQRPSLRMSSVMNGLHAHEWITRCRLKVLNRVRGFVSMKKSVKGSATSPTLPVATHSCDQTEHPWCIMQGRTQELSSDGASFTWQRFKDMVGMSMPV